MALAGFQKYTNLQAGHWGLSRPSIGRGWSSVPQRGQ